ncbi:MAG TPA: copper-binding protein [Duganella sp.]|nr:copper-binding protein [Duganella sp.]
MKLLNKLILAVVLGMSIGAAHAAMSEGEIKKVDKEAGKLTIKHGELKNLDMPGMTMVFKVKDPAMLDQVKQGDKVQFVADKVNGALTVTTIEVAK